MRHVLALGLVLSSTPALADYTEVAPVRPLTLSDPAGLSSVSLEFQLTRWTQPQVPPLPDVDFQNLTFDLAADITLAKHWQLLARMPITKTGIEDADCCDLAIGNLTVGGRGLWSSVGTVGRTVAGFEFSLSLPTASDEDEGLVSANGAAGRADPLGHPADLTRDQGVADPACRHHGPQARYRKDPARRTRQVVRRSVSRSGHPREQ